MRQIVEPEAGGPELDDLEPPALAPDPDPAYEPEEALGEICALVPASTAQSVIPLAEPGMVAVHALVPSADVWRLLPRLEAAGATSILLVPIERMLA